MKSFFLRYRLALLLLFFSALCLPLILHKGETNYSADETYFHLPSILQIRAHWPRLDLKADSLSATAPGYQYVLAGVSLLTGPDKTVMRLLNLGTSLGVLVVLWFAWPRGTDGALRLAALLPLAACNFFVKSASYVVTDNAALLATAACLVLTLLGNSPSRLPCAGLAAAAAAAIFFRQINIWLEASLCLRLIQTTRPACWWPVLPPLAMLAWLVHAWGGLVPPTWTSHHRSGLVMAALSYQLALFPLIGLFYYAAASPKDWPKHLLNRWTVIGASLGLLGTLAGPTFPSVESGRWSGYLWPVAEHLPVIGHISLLFAVMAPLGGAILGLLARHLWRTAGPEFALPWLVAVLGFMATGLINRQVFQRYYEPSLLVLLLIWLAIISQRSPAPPRFRLTPLYLLGALELGVTTVKAYGRTFGLL